MKKHSAWSGLFLSGSNKNRGLVMITVIAFMLLPFVVQADFDSEFKFLDDVGTSLNGRMGYTVAIDGDVAVAGQTFTFGRITFAERDSNGDWVATSSFYIPNIRFGQTISISGNYAVIGAQQADEGGLTNSGSAYVYVRDTATGLWSLQQIITASDAEASDAFGSSVAIHGDTAVVGAAGNGVGGAAYVFVRDAGGTWSQQAKLVSSDSASSDYFGIRAALDTDRAIIGAYGDNPVGSGSGSAGTGAAYIFERTGTNWTQTSKLVASDATYTDFFGYAVDISGDYALVGTWYAESAYIFERDATGSWSQIKILTGSGFTGNEGFGTAVTLSGDTAVVGAPYDDSNGSTDTGSVLSWVKDASSTNWIEQTKLIASDGVDRDNFGSSLSMSGNTLMVGAPNIDTIYPTAVATDTGAVYMYKSAGVTVTAPDISVTDAVAPTTDLQIPFGNVTTSTTSDQTLTVTNIGNADLLLGPIATANQLIAPYSLMIDNCSGVTLIPGASCTLDIRFAPSSAGTAVDSFDIPSNDPDENPITISVSGVGVVTTVPDITLSKLSHDFGSVSVGTTLDATVTVTNDGNANLAIGTIAASDVLAAPFSVLNDSCSGQTLNPAKSCTFDVRFAPAAAVIVSDSFDLPSNDPDENPVIVSLSGAGTAVPIANINVTPASMNFPDTTVGLMLTPQDFIITNDGNADLALSTITLGGADAAEFTLDLTTGNAPCGVPPLVITPALNCTGSVGFMPTVAAAANGSLQIVSDDPDTPVVTLSLSGTGLAPGANNPPSQPLLFTPANGSIVDSPFQAQLAWNHAIDPDGTTVSYTLFLCTDANPLVNCPVVQVTHLSASGNDDVMYASFVPSSRSDHWSRGGVALALILVVLIVVGILIGSRKAVCLLTMFLLFGSLVASCGSKNDNFDGVTYTASGLSSGTTYYWSVVAKDGAGGETASDVWSFTTP